ncbi:MAG: hypothetical protein IBX50_12130 [Marinospirillum sp.]|uniref:hypothetical protein n=1 Tax=Marinospirillum sp. TaxID=2183934 RepID=UPI001A086C64|nr:hypothetical protein [Marinospirillum sp.]MBE0507444.1 hypothetical protein [Marinospirillum sp.]
MSDKTIKNTQGKLVEPEDHFEQLSLDATVLGTAPPTYPVRSDEVVSSENMHPGTGRSFDIALFGLHPNRMRSQAGQNWSNSFAAFTSLPWFNLNKKDLYVPMRSQPTQPIRQHSVQFGGNAYKLTIAPALINRSHWRDLGPREEMVLDGLIKMATSSRGLINNGRAGTAFTIRSLLSIMQCRLNHVQVVEALDVLSGAQSTLTYTSAKGTTVTERGSLLPRLKLVRREEWMMIRKNNEEIRSDDLCYAEFHPLISDAIQQASYRIYDLDTYYRISSYVGRRLYKFLCQIFRAPSVYVADDAAAEELRGFTLHARHFLISCAVITLEEDASEDHPVRISHKLATIKKALNALTSAGVLSSYQMIKKKKEFVSQSQAPVITDYIFHIVASREFAEQQRRSNFAALDTAERHVLSKALLPGASEETQPVVARKLLTASTKQIKGLVDDLELRPQVEQITQAGRRSKLIKSDP